MVSLRFNTLKLLGHLRVTTSYNRLLESLISLVTVTRSHSSSQVNMLLGPTQLGHLYNILYGNSPIYLLPISGAGGRLT